MVSEDDYFSSKNLVSLLFKRLHNGVQFFCISQLPSNNVIESLGMKGDWVT